MLTLSLREPAGRIPVEAECITADGLRSLAPDQIKRLTVFWGNRETSLGELFDVSGDASDGVVQLDGDCSTVKWIGARMTGGEIRITGDVGMHLGAEMRGGRIIVEGNCGDWVGAEMNGGVIHVKGDAGHLAGGAYRGSSTGMRGGILLIQGSAGNEVGCGMRRGWIAVGGDCGDFAGVSMTAGSLFVFGKPGIRLGAGMKRGTIALFGNGPDIDLLPTFRFDCDYSPQFVELYLAQLRRRRFPLKADYNREGIYRRFNGDLLELGKGEVLAWKPNR